MNKGLKALERLMESYYEMCVIDNCNDDMYQKFNNSSERGIIEKELKALEIIKKSKIVGLTLGWDGKWWTVHAPDNKFPIAYGDKKEEYDLLKEVLTDD